MGDELIAGVFSCRWFRTERTAGVFRESRLVGRQIIFRSSGQSMVKGAPTIQGVYGETIAHETQIGRGQVRMAQLCEQKRLRLLRDSLRGTSDIQTLTVLSFGEFRGLPSDKRINPALARVSPISRK